jgi:hypothetical protein
VPDTGIPDQAKESTDVEVPADVPYRDAGRQAAEELLGRDIVALGERIVAELGGTDATLLARWMAFRIAELMQRVDQEIDAAGRERAAQQCADLILQVWRARTRWPQGWPPETAAQVVAGLEDRGPWRRASVPEDDEEVSWLTTLPAASDSLEAEHELWQLTALAETDPTDIRAWLDQPGAELGEEERALLETITEAAEQSKDRLTDRLASAYRRRGHDIEHPVPTAIEERARITLRELRRLSRARLKLAERVVAAAALERHDQPTNHGSEQQPAT